MPDDPKLYTHRIGRTARVGKDGISIAIVTGDDMKSFSRILERNYIEKIEAGNVPRAVFHMPRPNFRRIQGRGFHGRSGGSSYRRRY